MSARSGERLGPYRLRELIGQGGMGMVFLASAPDGKPVAVKCLRQGVPGEQTARRRLAREVETMRLVQSPFVAEVLDADIGADPPYIVTQYAPGRTLEDVVADEGPLTGEALATLARGLAAALEAIHSAGVVHRDLKPGNVMMVDGKPVVIDFGIAQTPDSTRLTMSGMFMGTPGYLAPEVIEGGDSSPAADVHSWAATVAYAATGRPPFGTGQFQAIFYRIMHGQADLETMPLALQPVIRAALARDPAQRPSAAELTRLVATLEPVALVAAPAGADMAGAPRAYQPPWQLAGTAVDLPAVPDGRNLTVSPALRPGTRPMGVSSPAAYADLLPPVRYQPPAPAQAGPVPIHRAQPAAPPQTGQAPGRRGAAAPASPARGALVLATAAGLVAMTVFLPVAGAVIALSILMLLRAGDLTASRLNRRRAGQGARASDAVSAVGYFPWAVVRSVLRFVLLAPLALLCAGVVLVLAMLAGGLTELPRAVSYASGALVACYCLGPGSAACRRPLNRLYGRITRSAPAAALGTITVAALVLAVIGAALRLAPGYWPAAHFGNELHTAAISHPGFSDVADVGRRLIHWLGARILR